MYKFDGHVIYESHDDDGIIEVIDRQGVRSLHFGTYPRQSSFLLKDPDKLELEYVQAMTSWQLFKPDLDDEALIIGLGGGSLTKHLLKLFPGCLLKVVEYRRSVVKVALNYFGLPQDERLKIVITDGARYVARRAEEDKGRYGLIFVDAFDHEGMAESICNQAFFDACHGLLKPDGIMVINLWGGIANPQFIAATRWIGSAFDWQALFLPVKDRGNVIGLAFKEAPSQLGMDTLRARADTLEMLHQLPFTTFLRDLKKHNASVFKRMIKP